MKPSHVSFRLERTPQGGRPRFYEISLSTGLFGETLMRRYWGGVGRRGGQLLVASFPTLSAARRAAGAWLRRKRRRGYRAARRRDGA